MLEGCHLIFTLEAYNLCLSQMKPILFSFLIIALLASCKSNKKQAAADSVAIVPKADNAKQLIAEFTPIIQGMWLKISYIDKVLRTKSPLAAVDKVDGLTAMYIDTHKIKGDSLEVEGGWGNHEGGNFYLFFKHPQNNNSAIMINGGTVSYSIEHGDTILTISQKDEEYGNKIVATKYKRASLTKGESLGYWMDYRVNKGLVAGNYSFADSIGTISKITLTPDGKVKGLADFISYYINIDLNMEPMDNLDDIGFRNAHDVYKRYSFKINADTLKLFDTKPNADSSLAVLDKLRYTLVRQK
jgi:hypothetical protein